METHVVTLARSLPASVCRFVCCFDASADYRARLMQAEIDHCSLNCRTLIRPGGILGYLRFERVVARFRPHIVHSYGFLGDVVAGLLRARGSRVRIITSRRGEDASRRHQAVRRVVNRFSDKIVCVSPETATFVHSTESPQPGLLEIIPNGVTVDPWLDCGRLRPPSEPLKFGTLGTVKPVKGTDRLVDAFMRFDSTERVELRIAGVNNRPWAAALQQRARADTRIRFLGHVSQPSSFLSDLDAFVLPSRSEGMSNALLEAMAMGLPCIATDVGSNRSLLQRAGEATAGIVCASTTDALFDSMNHLVHDGDARRQYGERAHRVASQCYTTEAMVHRYDALYRSIVRPDAHGGGRRSDAAMFL
jgi:glycosyltransferase involved in cell wall biosynthesis